VAQNALALAQGSTALGTTHARPSAFRRHSSKPDVRRQDPYALHDVATHTIDEVPSQVVARFQTICRSATVCSNERCAHELARFLAKTGLGIRRIASGRIGCVASRY
jgi:hypothetical protein